MVSNLRSLVEIGLVKRTIKHSSLFLSHLEGLDQFLDEREAELAFQSDLKDRIKKIRNGFSKPGLQNTSKTSEMNK